MESKIHLSSIISCQEKKQFDNLKIQIQQRGYRVPRYFSVSNKRTPKNTGKLSFLMIF